MYMKTIELIYMVLDLCKVASDDAYFTEEHVEWLLNRNRSFLLKREEERLKERGSDMNKQTICIDLQKDVQFCGDPCDQIHLKSIQKIPDIVSSSIPTITSMDRFNPNISYIPFEKMKYVGFNKYLRNIIFASVSPDNYVYLKSVNPMFENLSKIQITGVFDDFVEAAKLSCENNDGNGTCDTFEMEFPIDSYLVPELIDRVLRELLGGLYRPKDNSNNENDDLSYIETFIRNHIKQPLARQIEGVQSE